jgi:chemotaxis protein methyltransferase CheR
MIASAVDVRTGGTGGWSEPALARIARAVQERAGLTFPANRIPSAENGIRRAMASLGMADAAQYAEVVKAGGAAFEELMTELTVGETYFFRESAQLDYVRRNVLPLFEGKRDPENPLRAWSAGCASGEEAYSLSIMLREEGWTERSRVLGTDVARPRLAAARAGVYTRWSLRGVEPEVVDNYFTRRGSRFVLAPEIRQAATFRALNLAESGWPSPATGTTAVDLILCRNVLIYFDRDAMRAVVHRLLSALSDDGWLFLGASDPPISEWARVEVVVTGAGLAYRPLRGGATPGPPAPTMVAPPAALPTLEREVPLGTIAQPPLPLPVEPVRELPPPLPRAHIEPEHVPTGIAAAYARREYDRAISLAEEEVEHGGGDPAVWVVLVRALANRGQLEEAGHACAAALDRHRGSAELLHLHALLLLQGGRAAEAAVAARRALYLDRSMIVAHMVLGAALSRAGDRDGARRAYANALSLAERLPVDTIVPGSDDETAHRLVQLARTQLRLHQDVPR